MYYRKALRLQAFLDRTNDQGAARNFTASLTLSSLSLSLDWKHVFISDKCGILIKLDQLAPQGLSGCCHVFFANWYASKSSLLF
jgi:hypothetical protein